ncbi:MAG: DUF2804 domain-containing protein [Deltaproteobacteria bacterium]|nr:DUF2804 domain-containing protein [Deltaproteobacteria bacterium]
MAEPTKRPERIVEPDGRVNVGWFDRPFPDDNISQAPVRHLLAGLRDTPLSALERAWRRLRFKQWQYMSVVTDRVLLGCAVVHVGYVGQAFAYVVDRSTAKMFEWTRLVPLARGVGVAPGSADGGWRIDAPGWGWMALEADAAAGRRSLRLGLDGRGGHRPQPPLEADVEIRDDSREPAPVVVVEQSAEGRWLLTHKCYGLPAGGAIRCGDVGGEFELGAGLAGLDFNRGYRPNRTYWNWAAAAGRAKDGRIVGFNLTAHRPWEGAKARRPEHARADRVDAGDCAFWLGGELVKVRRVEFRYDHRDLLAPWRVSDTEGSVDL